MAKATTVSVLQKEGLLKIEKFTEKTCAVVSFLIKFRFATLLKKRQQQMYCPVNSEKFLGTSFLLTPLMVACLLLLNVISQSYLFTFEF